jgi:6-phosphogluconolactonase
MSRSALSCLLLAAFGPGTVLVAGTARAEDPVLFVSAFAPGPKGAIHAFRFDTTQGTLSPLERTGDVEHPFFLALSPDGRFLYSIQPSRSAGRTRNRSPLTASPTARESWSC